VTTDEVAKDIVDAAIKVHRALGPGLLESAYQACLAHELRRREHGVEYEVALGLQFEGMLIEVGYRIYADRRAGSSREQDGGKDSSHAPGTVVDLPQTERLVFGVDYQLERDPASRWYPASGPKPS